VEKSKEKFLKKKGENLPYLGEVKEERYLVCINNLKWTKKDWEKFLINIGLIFKTNS